MRLVNDESAPAFKAMRTDLLYPFRQKELVARVNELLAGLRITVTTCIAYAKPTLSTVSRTSSTSHSSHLHNTVRPSRNGWQNSTRQTRNSSIERARHPKNMSPSRNSS